MCFKLFPYSSTTKSFNRKTSLVSAYGAPTLLASRSGFIARIKQKSPNAVGTHCVIHREALASKTLTAAMKDKLAIAI